MFQEINSEKKLTNPKSKVLFFILFMTFIVQLASCNIENNDKSRISEVDSQKYILNRQFDSLFSEKDTLAIYLKLSGSISRRFDIIRFFKINDTIYIKPEINIRNEKEELILGKAIRYNLLSTDSLSFENLLNEIQLKLPDIPDSLGNESVCISIGVLHKWGKNYYTDTYDTHFSIFKLYETIMHELYPEMNEFMPIEPLIFDEEI